MALSLDARIELEKAMEAVQHAVIRVFFEGKGEPAEERKRLLHTTLDLVDAKNLVLTEDGQDRSAAESRAAELIKEMGLDAATQHSCKELERFSRLSNETPSDQGYTDAKVYWMAVYRVIIAWDDWE
tara:strand:- start:4316 stop:4696 length:381 start_codon:yes stop_codon:yes gene_type:complete